MLANLADVTKARTLLHWNPRINLDEGLQQTVAWHRQEQSWLQNIKID